jgi:hypothetical protein
MGRLYMAVLNRRRNERISFERGIDVQIMGIDGTWRRDCSLEDVSETGAKLRAGLGQRQSAPREIRETA